MQTAPEDGVPERPVSDGRVSFGALLAQFAERQAQMSEIFQRATAVVSTVVDPEAAATKSSRSNVTRRYASPRPTPRGPPPNVTPASSADARTTKPNSAPKLTRRPRRHC
ncbi:hypothetical protein [Pseudonocardia sp.]|uniref:hypothetical protein n=1 Tax=Pseudonocardia sp. TaxID=60912 RepID=UPI002F41A82E